MSILWSREVSSRSLHKTVFLQRQNIIQIKVKNLKYLIFLPCTFLHNIKHKCFASNEVVYQFIKGDGLEKHEHLYRIIFYEIWRQITNYTHERFKMDTGQCKQMYIQSYKRGYPSTCITVLKWISVHMHKSQWSDMQVCTGKHTGVVNVSTYAWYKWTDEAKNDEHSGHCVVLPKFQSTCSAARATVGAAARGSVTLTLLDLWPLSRTCPDSRTWISVGSLLRTSRSTSWTRWRVYQAGQWLPRLGKKEKAVK